MHENEIHKILAIGYSVRHIVCSGSRAGYEMYAADAFGDVDTRSCAKNHFPLSALQLQAHSTHLEYIKERIREVDGVIVASGFERVDFGFLNEEELEKIIGNAPGEMKAISNKMWLLTRLDELDIHHPLTYIGRDISAEEAKCFHYPVVAKPAYGGGGTANFFCNDEKELLRWANRLPKYLYQEYIEGKNASVSLIATRKEAISVSVNEQLIGLESLCASGPFVYCGNISPLATPFSAQMCEIAEELTNDLGLIGSNGVDFVCTDEGPFVIEVNPRFQGSLDTVELSTGLNLIDAHVNAVVRDELPLPERVKPKRYAAKEITFAKQEGIVIEGFDTRVGIVDIPCKGRILKPGEPIATGIGVGKSRERAFGDAMKRVATIQAGVRYS